VRRRAAAAVAVAALFVAALAAGVAWQRTADRPAAAPTAAPTPAESPTARPTETLAEQLARVARLVAELRELEFATVPEPSLLTADEVAARVRDELAAYTPEEADLDRRTLELFGAVPPGTDLRAILTAALEAQVAGFYDPETGELVVNAASSDRRVGRLEEVTLAHELQHALADQVLGLPPIDDEDPLGGDAALARQSLVEGDATLTMQRYTEVGFSAVDQLLLAGEAAALAAELGRLEDLPYYVEQSLLFPYQAGLEFVTALQRQGGWAAVDAAYRRPPTTTAEILFPDRYLAGGVEPVEPARAAPPGPGWTHARAASLGAADLLLLLRAPGGDTERAVGAAAPVAAAWRGGRVDLFVDGERSALSAAHASDDLGTACEATVTWLERSDEGARRRPADGGATVVAGPARTAVVTCADGEVRVGIGPDLDTAARLGLRP
jgi:hypothetical protein